MKRCDVTCLDIELALARSLNYRANIIIPNVSWGLGLHECDLLVIHPSGWADEIEIKTSAADIRADLKKRHGHRSNKIRRLWFAVPTELADHGSIPARAGIYSMSRHVENNVVYCDKIRPAQINKNARKLSDREVAKAMHLSCMRLWDLKDVIRSRQPWLLAESP